MNFLSKLFILIFFFFNNLEVIANDSKTVIEIDQPKFSEKGLDQKSYEIKAQKGVRSGSELILFEVEGKFKTNTGMWIYMNANKGDYEQIENVIRLSKNVNFYTDEGDKIISDIATFNINDDFIVLMNNVFYENKELKIRSDKIVISNNFESILHEGNVETEILK